MRKVRYLVLAAALIAAACGGATRGVSFDELDAGFRTWLMAR